MSEKGQKQRINFTTYTITPLPSTSAAPAIIRVYNSVVHSKQKVDSGNPLQDWPNGLAYKTVGRPESFVSCRKPVNDYSVHTPFAWGQISQIHSFSTNAATYASRLIRTTAVIGLKPGFNHLVQTDYQRSISPLKRVRLRPHSLVETPSQ